MPPAWIMDIFAAAMLSVTAVSAARLAATWLAAARLNPGRSWPRQADYDAVHLLMGIAMAGMLVARVKTLPDGAWEVVFGLATAWFAWKVVRDARANGVRALAGGHCTPHMVHCAAMVYMYVALTGAGSTGAGMSGGGAQMLADPTLAFAFGLVLAGYSVWDLDQLSGRRRAVTAVAAVPAIPVASGAGSAGTGSADVVPVAQDISPARRLLTPPALVTGCRIAIGVTMAFMLFIMI